MPDDRTPRAIGLSGPPASSVPMPATDYDEDRGYRQFDVFHERCLKAHRRSSRHEFPRGSDVRTAQLSTYAPE